MKKASQESRPGTSKSRSPLSTSHSMSQMIVKSKMCCAKKSTPEERWLGKFAYFRNDESSESPEDEPNIDLTEHGDPPADEEVKPVEPSSSDVAKAPKKQGNKGKKCHKNAAKEASQAHKQMCSKCAIRPCKWWTDHNQLPFR